jgi:FtsK/SpoIIIE family
MSLVVDGDRRAVQLVIRPASLPSRLRPVQRRRALRAERFEFDRDVYLAHRFQEVCVALGLVASQASIAAGTQFSVPRVIAVRRGEPTVLVVDTLPGQLVGDYAQHSVRIASAMSVARVRFEPLGPSQMRVELLATDPLSHPVALGAPLRTLHDRIYLGRDDTGLDYWITPIDLVHLIVQGATGSGKSVFVYGLLTQLVAIPDILLAMSDPTGLLTRPFAGTVHDEWMVGGTSDPDAHIELLQRLVDMMDDRISTMPARCDQVEMGEGCPLVMVFLEEYPGLIRSATARDDGKKSGGRVEKIKGLVGRLAAESRKAGIRVVIMAQRAEAGIIDSYTRGQMTIKLSFRVAEAASVEMLHPAGKGMADDHSTASPGIALLSGPGIALQRIKTPYIGCSNGEREYATFWDLVTARAARLPDNWS